MSGHSKWSTIKRAKGAADAKRGKLFTKLGKIITVAVSKGGSDSDTNPALANAITKARQNNMPKDNIERCIKKAAGEKNAGNYMELTYEGYGIGGSAVIVNVLTDNKNRTAGDVRHAFDKFGGSLGSNGCVSFMFNRVGRIIIDEESAGLSEDEMFEMVIEAGADDVKLEEGVFEIITDQNNLNSVADFFTNKGLTFLSSGVELVSENTVELDDKKYATFEKMTDMLEDNDDVQSVFHNVK